MFDPGRNFFVPSIDHWTSLRISKIPTGSFDDVTTFWVMIAALRAFEAPFGWIEISFIPTLITVIDRGICSKIGDPIISVIPNRF